MKTDKEWLEESFEQAYTAVRTLREDLWDCGYDEEGNKMAALLDAVYGMKREVLERESKLCEHEVMANTCRKCWPDKLPTV